MWAHKLSKQSKKSNIFYTKWKKKVISRAQLPGRWWLIEEKSPKTGLLVRPEAGIGPAASHMRPGVRRSCSTTHSWLTASYALGITSPVFAQRCHRLYLGQVLIQNQFYGVSLRLVPFVAGQRQFAHKTGADSGRCRSPGEQKRTNTGFQLLIDPGE